MGSRTLFFKKWLSSPLQIGSIIPSSISLTNAITEQILQYVNVKKNKILSVGTGTGPLFRSFRKYKIPANNVTSVELDNEMREVSLQKFSEFNVINEDICLLHSTIKNKFSAVVSALPLTIMSNADEAISSMIDFLDDDGVLIQYTYRLFSSAINAKKHNLTLINKKRVIINLPPATVLVYSKSNN